MQKKFPNEEKSSEGPVDKGFPDNSREGFIECESNGTVITHSFDVHLQDSVFEMERQRNRPVRYDRNLMAATVSAMKKVAEVREKRQSRFYDNRMKGKKERELKAARSELERDITLVKSAVAMASDPSLELPKQVAPAAAEADKLKVPVRKSTRRKATAMEIE
eukprot:jgi/Mesvir1/6436/Mv19521-RA.1